MDPFIVQKVARLYGLRVTIEDPDKTSGHSRQVWAHTIHTSHLAPFDEPYVESQEIIMEGTKKMPKPVRFQHGTAKGTAKWMVDQADFVLRRAGRLCLHQASVRGGRLSSSLRPACI